MDENEETELRNPFPSPPSHYTNYTAQNLRLLSLLQERAPNDPDANQADILNDQQDIPDWPLRQLEKPRIDWILDEPNAHYEVFGEQWLVKDTIPSLKDSGGTQLYPVDPNEDRRPALVSILKSMLVTYSTLTSAMLAPPPTMSSTNPPEWMRHVEWITVLSQNLLAAANDLRPVQARSNLESMMERQIELRKEETRAIHSKCDALEEKLKELQQSALQLPEPNSNTFSSTPPSPSDKPTLKAVDELDVLKWSEEIG